ncbi:MAG: DUF115 domain-containing protein [Spirochaetaceae bacterium]|jgi:hypothetical protein|nr:DUF115 domain-containing protein [Spirochaetaceae bacterium]
MAIQQASVLHSRYNPEKEAEKYINSLSFRDLPQFLILIEPGRGYMIPILHRKFPEAKILVIHAEPQEYTEKIPITVWDPDRGLSLERFLEQEIPDVEASAVRIIEWRPALGVYGETYRKLVDETVKVLKRLDANKRTAKTFGLRWYKNFFKILNSLKTVIYQTESLSALPCVVAGAGPSLEETLPLIKAMKKRHPLLVISVSAAGRAFQAAGLRPDIIAAADGGNWALSHLYECLRGNNLPFGLASSLFGAFPSQAADKPLLLISDGSLWQTLILRKLNLPFISLPQRGTVTATALDLAFALTRGNVFITGMDLSHRDIRTHVRPYGFDIRLEEQANRFNPVYNQTFTRSAGILSGGSHNIYAAWFSSQLNQYPKRLYTLGKNHPVFDDLPTASSLPADRFEASSRSGGNFKVRTWPEKNLARQGTAILITALQDPQTAKPIAQELASLLFPDLPAQENPPITDLCDRVQGIAEIF